MKQVDAKRLVIVDECGSNIALTPLYGWAPQGQRAHGSVPRNRGKNTTLLASLSLSGIGASMIIEGSVNALAEDRLCRAHSGPESVGWADRDAGQFECPQRGAGASAHRGAWL